VITLVSSCLPELLDSHSTSSPTRCMSAQHSRSSEVLYCKLLVMPGVRVLIVGTEVQSALRYPLSFGLFTPALSSLRGKFPSVEGIKY